MKFTTLIPLNFNDGKKVPKAVIDGIIDALVLKFGGCSNEGITQGQWLDPKDRERYRDKSRRLTIVCDNALLWDAREAVIEIGQTLGQRAMYFEVRDYDGVQILEIPQSKKGK